LKKIRGSKIRTSVLATKTMGTYMLAFLKVKEKIKRREKRKRIKIAMFSCEKFQDQKRDLSSRSKSRIRISH